MISVCSRTKNSTELKYFAIKFIDTLFREVFYPVRPGKSSLDQDQNYTITSLNLALQLSNCRFV
jgi:hypothetical protein